MSAARDEIDRLLDSPRPPAAHPEDCQPDITLSSLDDNNNDDDLNSHRNSRPSRLRYVPSEDEDDDDDTDDAMMVSKPPAYHIPTTVYDANTGPKGVIADAQSYERAKKRSFRRVLMSAAGLDSPVYAQDASVTAAGTATAAAAPRQRTQSPAAGARTPPDESGDDDDRFMREWREARMRELQNKTARRSSPSKRCYGTVDAVNANGYLDAVEKVTADTVVVVCIYDPQSSESSIVEDCLNTVARKHVTVHFVKLHHEIAEMDHIEAPALLAYRNGDVFATIVDIFKQLPDGRDCSSSSLEALLMQNHVV
ncbi:hypothetical protein LOZ53_006555 [Ophidiomyces ophidiicola]|nr:hypothetical protein LOZ53_006555 [Ophidiomyces ophidiicola]